MLGNKLFDEVATYLDSRMVPGAPPVVTHPAQVPVTLGASRNGSGKAKARRG
jgi:hypothetical protein